jgi:inosine-uridine nucleoside N-ribohydrolase
MKNVLIDCDPGIDDSVALLFALSNSNLAIKAITTVSGNLLAPTCASNLRKILHLSNNSTVSQIPTATGPPKPLVRPYPRDPFSHGTDGLADLGLKDEGELLDCGIFAPDLIIQIADKFAKSDSESGLTILCLGPLTNLALAAIKDPSLSSKVADVLFIGGSFGFHSTGTVRATGDNPVSEWNVYVDPEAANLVFAAGFKLTALGLDIVTHPDLELSTTHLELLGKSSEEGNSSAKFLLDVVAFASEKGFASWCCLIDSVAIAVAIDATIVKTEGIRVLVETQSLLSLGQTIVDRRERKEHQTGIWVDLPVIRAACDIDAGRFLDLLVNNII